MSKLIPKEDKAWGFGARGGGAALTAVPLTLLLRFYCTTTTT